MRQINTKVDLSMPFTSKHTKIQMAQPERKQVDFLAPINRRRLSVEFVRRCSVGHKCLPWRIVLTKNLRWREALTLKSDVFVCRQEGCEFRILVKSESLSSGDKNCGIFNSSSKSLRKIQINLYTFLRTKSCLN